jgi:hypothetical protein
MMNARSIGTIVLAAIVTAVGCSSASSEAPKGGPLGNGSSATSVIGAKGGVLVHPDGASLAIPPGALAADRTITVTASTAGPDGPFSTWNSPVFRFTPDDVTFDVPATVSIGFTGGPTAPTLYWSLGGTFVPLPTTVTGTTASASIVGLGGGFVGPSQTVTPPGDDKCAPYVGDYAGILEFKWSAYSAPSECASMSPRSGVGTLTVHFTTTCLGPTPDGQIVLNVTTVSSDDSYFQTTTPSPADPALSQMVMPPNPPAGGTGAIGLGFKHGYLTMGTKVTVTTGAAKIASDVGVTDGWSIGGVPGDPDNAGYWPIGLPKPIGAVNCVKIDSRTFKIDKL